MGLTGATSGGQVPKSFPMGSTVARSPMLPKDPPGAEGPRGEQPPPSRLAETERGLAVAVGLRDPTGQWCRVGGELGSFQALTELPSQGSLGCTR